MVLARSIAIKTGVNTAVFVCLLTVLSACSVLQNVADDKSAPIPASIPDDQRFSQEEVVSDDEPEQPKKNTHEGSNVTEEGPQENREQDLNASEPTPFEPRSAPENLLNTLLEKARKAINKQQWLRAQRSLEQALRVDSTMPDIYLLYSEVYAGMGLAEKAEEMIKRAESYAP